MFVAHNQLKIESPEQAQMLEQRFAMAGDHMKNVPGFLAFQLMKATDASHFIVSTTWESEERFKAWIESPHFAAAHGGNRSAGSAAVTTYQVIYPAE